jgi:hypothetical protein
MCDKKCYSLGESRVFALPGARMLVPGYWKYICVYHHGQLTTPISLRNHSWKSVPVWVLNVPAKFAECEFKFAKANLGSVRNIDPDDDKHTNRAMSYFYE